MFKAMLNKLSKLIASLMFILGTSLLLSSCHQDNTPILEQVRHSGELVIATRNSPTTYFKGPEGATGFEYELVRLFADDLGVELKLVTPNNFNEILPLVSRNKVHFAAAGLTVTESRKKLVRFTPAFQEITQQLVYRHEKKAPRNLAELDGQLTVIAGSSHAEQLRKLAKDYPKLHWLSEPGVGSVELLSQVWDRELDYTIADSNEFTLNQHLFPELRVAFDVSEPEHLAWAFPQGKDNSLFDEATKFLKKIKQNGQLAKLEERYFSHVEDFDYVETRKFLRHVDERLVRYLPDFLMAAEKYQMDWRLLAAIGYQESHWNPRAKSPTGVRGIMMLTQITASDLGISDRINPKNSIMGGAQYFKQLKQRIPERIPDPDSTWFALASYNIGIGHLEDARIITQKRGGDPDAWKDVKESLPLLMQKKWYKKTRHGYARGLETVQYVENIRTYYDILQQQTQPITSQVAAL